MRLPFDVRSKINLHIGRSPPDTKARKDWILGLDGIWKTENGQFQIVTDAKYGLVVAENVNVGYGSD
jgi:hypothetical protein